MRFLRLPAFSVVVLMAACGDSDDDLNSSLTVNAATVATAEDTPVSGALAVTGNAGRVRAAVTSGPTHGELAVSGTAFTYTPAANYAGEDSVTLALSDDDRTVDGVITFIVTPVDDAPVLGVTQLTVAEDSSLTIDAASLSITDVDSAGPFAVTVATDGAYLVAGNEVSPFPNFNGPLNVRLTVTDGQTSAEATIVVDVTPVNDAPHVTVPAPLQAPNGAAFAVTGVSVNDIDAGSTPVAVELAANAGTMTLAVTEGITFAAGDGADDATMRFSGPISAINGALASLSVAAANDVGVTVTVTVNDLGATGAGGELVDSDAVFVGFGSADRPPFNTVPASLATSEDTALVINTISVADTDAAEGATVTMALTVTHGTLVLSGVTGLTNVGGLTTASVSFTGSFASVNAALAGMTYTPTRDYAGADTLTVTSTSDGLSDSDVIAVTVSAVNDAPSLAGPASSLEITSSQSVSFTGGNAIVVSDVDAGEAGVTLTVSVSAGTFAIASPVLPANTSTPNVMVITGTVAQLNDELQRATWSPNGTTGNNKTVTFSVNDQGATGSGGARSDTLVVTINVDGTLGASADAYTAQGNVRRVVEAPGVLANDSGIGRAVTSLSPITTALGGSVTMTSTGGFTYVPPTGVGGRQNDTTADGAKTDSFEYAITGNGGATATARVEITIFRVIWFVDGDDAGSLQTGTRDEPFRTLTQAVTAAGGSHYGTYIYVENASSAYTVDAVTVPRGTSIIGSREPYQLQDGDSSDGYSATSTVLPASGAITVRAANTTAFRMNDTSRIYGMTILPGASTVGPAVVGLAGNSGVWDFVTIDGFDTAIALTATDVEALRIDNVTITNARTAAVTSTSDTNSRLVIVNSTFTNVGRGVSVEVVPGANDNGRMSLFFLTSAVREASDVGIAFTSTAGGAAVLGGSELAVRDSDVVNSGAAGTTAIAINAQSGGCILDLEDVELGGFRNGLAVSVGDADVNAELVNLQLLAPGPGPYENGVRISGGAGAAGSIDVTASGLSSSTGNVPGFSVSTGGLDVCLDIASSVLTTSGASGLSLSQAGGVLALEAFTGSSASDVQAYFASAPARVTGTVTSTGTITGRTACEAPAM